jgi:hypothetical protein
VARDIESLSKPQPLLPWHLKTKLTVKFKYLNEEVAEPRLNPPKTEPQETPQNDNKEPKPKYKV